MCSICPVCCSDRQPQRGGVLISADAENEEPDANVIVSDAATPVYDRDAAQDLVPADTFVTLPNLEPPLQATDLPVGTQFAVHVEKQGGNRLGVRLTQTKKTISIQRIDPGPFTEWNVSNPDKMVQVGDLILEVNGERGKTDIMLESMLHEMIWDLIVARGTSQGDVSPRE